MTVGKPYKKQEIIHQKYMALEKSKNRREQRNSIPI